MYRIRNIANALYLLAKKCCHLPPGLTAFFAACAFLASGYGYHLLLERAHHHTQEIIARLSEKTGIDMQVERQTFGFGSVRLENVVIKRKFEVAINYLEASVNLNPFRGRIGELSQIQLGNVKGKLTLAEMSQLATLYNLNKQQRTDKKLTVKDGAVWLPRSMSLQRSSIQFVDENNRPLIHMKGLSAKFDQQAGTLSFKTRAITWREQTLVRGLQGKLFLDSQSDSYPFTFDPRHTPYLSGEIRGQVKKDFSGFKLYAKTLGLPELLQNKFQAWVKNGDNVRYAISMAAHYYSQQERVAFAAHVGVSDLILQHPVLSATEVGPVPFEVKASGSLWLEDTTFAIDRGEAILRARNSPTQERVGVNFTVHKRQLFNWSDAFPLTWEAQLALTPCQSILDTLPAALVPKVKGFHLKGNAQLAVTGTLPSLDLNHLNYQVKNQEFTCQVDQTPYAYTRQGIYDLQLAQVLPAANAAINPDLFVTFDDMSPHLSMAIVASEDANFWQHKGIEWQAIAKAMQKNLKQGSVVLGGSTISMQTVKNLFLSSERTIARKTQELFLTWYLENLLSKEKIFELYANIIEYGPGIYGIKQASEIYFNKHPRDLTLQESISLASMLPNPKKRFRQFCSESGQQIVKRRLDQMLALNFIDRSAYQEAMRRPVVFSRSANSPFATCRQSIAGQFDGWSNM